MVPLKDAWDSGASARTTDKRQGLANDVDAPQLWVVTDNVNQAKGDKSPDEWKPPLEGFWCVYAKSWAAVKGKWGLSVMEKEKGALEGMLGGCKGEALGGGGTQSAVPSPTGSGGAVKSGADRVGGGGWVVVSWGIASLLLGYYWK